MINIQKRIKKIMAIKDLNERAVALRELAAKIGCSLSSTYAGDKHLEEEVIRRIQEAARSERESRLWWIAFLSGIASVLSALAAWLAVMRILAD